ncbi:MAG: UDP-N-acetylmuramoyl-tripeptide--D-alanyl-D-alanine ligase [Lachnospiraceae bacterium]|nr:UDP-N-acetylmuramoyl-tripeptide--D-alanyl-D-alanine ligase [Lachnospiraceae bacterium]
MKAMTLENLAKACGGKLVCKEEIPGAEASCVVIDSRRIEAGGVFVATRGERVDGHSFIPQVFEAGALAVVCEKLPEEPYGPCILVEDSFAALTAIAAFYRTQLSCRFIGITGSVGKTSTKEMIAAVLRRRFRVCATEGNHNNEIGVPLTILRIREEDECAVVEMGINHFGEMTRLAKLVRPDIAVITNIGECHLEALGDRDGVLRAKTEVFDQMDEKGCVVLNGEDDKLQTIREVHGKAPVFYRLDKDTPDPACEGMPRHMRLNAQAARSVGRILGMTEEEIAQGLQEVKSMAGRCRIIKKEKFTLIDDYYNANPTSVKAALDLLCETAESGRIAVLGDMFELGEAAERLHAEVGRYAAEKGVERLLAAGELSRHMVKGFEEAGGGSSRWYWDTASLLEGIEEEETAGSTLLVKASHGMHFEKIVEVLENGI